MAITGFLPDEAVGPDQRPLLEVTSIHDDGKTVRLGGTACLPEGTVHIIVNRRSRRDSLSTAATAGGPERGTWQIDVPVPDRPARIDLGADNPGEGNILRLSMVVVAVS